ncbi:MAG: asparagine synthase (glutamine-hydrolyzing) [Candidatus Omnitrophota bacterium]
MCGIVGILNCSNNTPVDEEVLKKMRETMIHRGPDGAGIWISSDKRIGFAHRRLSIIDLSDAATQPMCNEDRSVWIVFNGEIYNHAELRQELLQKGHKFKTDHSDTEVIIHAYEQWGKACVLRFRGMFAFVIWDEKSRSLWFCRDYIGIKPLYYTFFQGKFIFASEIKAILAYPGMHKTVDEVAFYHYLSFLTTPAPQTLFAGIQKLPSGCSGSLNSDGQVIVERYWDVADNRESLHGVSEQKIAEKLLAELRTSVAYRKVSDVPVGIFLSGGLDSSTNAVLFAEGERKKIKTFSIGYDQEYASYTNEFAYARTVAKLIGAEHHEKILSSSDLLDFLPQLVYYQDEPIADPVCVPIYFISRLTRDQGVIVAQVGEGSDELFCGYPFWKTFIKLQELSNLPFMNSLKKMGMFFLENSGQELDMKYELLRRSIHQEPVFWGGAEGFNENEKKYLLSDRLKKKFKSYSSFEAIKPIWERFNAKVEEKSPLTWMGYLDLNLRLPELLLMRVDKMTMIASLEARVPFLDHKFVELAMSIPQSLKIKKGVLKYILKQSVKKILPAELVTRKKQGFTVPVTEWFLDKLGTFGREKIFTFCRRTDFFNKQYIEKLFQMNNGYKLWYILNFILWHEFWVEGKNENDWLTKKNNY